MTGENEEKTVEQPKRHKGGMGRAFLNRDIKEQALVCAMFRFWHDFALPAAKATNTGFLVPMSADTDLVCWSWSYVNVNTARHYKEGSYTQSSSLLIPA